MAAYNLSLPRGYSVTMSDDALAAGNAMKIKNAIYTEQTDIAGIRYMITYADNGYDQSYELVVTDAEGYTYRYTVNVSFLHDPLIKSVVPGCTADAAQTRLDTETSTIYVVAKPKKSYASFNLSLVSGSTVEVTSPEKPHFIQKVGASYQEVTEIDNSKLVYFKTYKTDGIDGFDIKVTSSNGLEETYRVEVKFPAN